MTKKHLEFITSDITFASALMCMGKHLTRTEPRPNRVYEREFYFDNEDGEIDDLLVKFVNGKMKVDPNSLMNNIRNLKSAIKNADIP